MSTHTVVERRFFSLIEILMAIVIAFILLAILIPSLLRAREYAWQSLCKSNMRNIAMGFRQYMVEYEEWPVTQYWLDDFQLIYPYTAQDGIFRCPKREYEYGEYGVWDEDNCLRLGDYYVSGEMQDMEKTHNYNNGHGNNPYHFDPSNPSPKTQAVIDAKDIDRRILYEKYWDCHFRGRELNVVYIDNMSQQVETEGFTRYWVLEERGWIDTSLDPFPAYLSYATLPGEGFDFPGWNALDAARSANGELTGDNEDTIH